MARPFWPAVAGLFAAGVLFAGVAFDRISADSLRANITWLAADSREGRLTPSAGLEASADYLAVQFRLAGLAPAGGEGTYFQSARFAQVSENPKDFRMTLESGGRVVNVRSTSVRVEAIAALELSAAPVVRLRGSNPMPAIDGKIVICDESFASELALHSLKSRKPSLILLSVTGERPKRETQLLEAEAANPPVIRIYDRQAATLLKGESGIQVTLHVESPVRQDVTLRNVAGLLRGSDPAVRDQVLILSAHYDHLGVKSPGQGNRIYHGANDDASGTASLVEIARALAGASPRPRRSILFLALFGEEEGLLGSGYYVRHPLVPLARTVADINLEQLGRTDSSDGPEVASFAFTGPSYSNLSRMMSGAATSAGVTVYRKETADDYFDRSDNYEFAMAGVVAHTLVVAFEFPDYHEVGDEAGKIDYPNLAKVDKGIAAGVAAVANAADAPKWSDAKAARVYRDAVTK